MSEIRYHVVVRGTALEGFELEQVKLEFAKLFSLAEARTEQIFEKGNVIIKKDVAEPTAKKFMAALERIGAAAHLRPLPTAVAPATDPEAVPLPTAPADKVAERATGALSAKPDSRADCSEAPEPQPFNFYGDGKEYFRIWIVNILLTIATLGIYSAWAKVRNAQYFYGHTELAGSRFAYHAKPLTILKGRILAVVLFVIYTAVSNLFPVAGFVLSLLLIAALPWITIRALRFNRRMSAWRNIRFGFDGKLGEAIGALILWPLLGVLTLGLLIPVAFYKQNEFIINNSRFGTARFTLAPCLKAFYLVFVVATLLLLAGGALAWALGLLFQPLFGLVMLVCYLYLFVYVSVRSNNLLFNHTTLRDGDFGFQSRWRDGSYLKLVLVNSLCTLLTLGLFYPWAMVRFARYRAEHLTLEANTDLEHFVADEAEQINAFGEEMGDVFDMEVGL